jgi:uncharacterized RDD family membrane protein YckC
MSTKKPGPFLGALDVSLDLPLADLGSRSIAYFIDWLLIVFVVLFGWLMAQWAGLTDLLFEGDDPTAALTVLAFLMAGSYFLFELLWFVGFEQAWGGLTPGKRWMGLRVVSREGAQVGLLSSLLRNLLRPIDQLPGSWSVAAFSMLVGEHRQRLGDLVAGTVVVVEPRETVHVHLGRLPPGLGEKDLALLEAWFRRHPLLRPERAHSLAARMRQFVEARWPGFVDPQGADDRAALEAAFAVERR